MVTSLWELTQVVGRSDSVRSDNTEATGDQDKKKNQLGNVGSRSQIQGTLKRKWSVRKEREDRCNFWKVGYEKKQRNGVVAGRRWEIRVRYVHTYLCKLREKQEQLRMVRRTIQKRGRGDDQWRKKVPIKWQRPLMGQRFLPLSSKKSK